MNGSMKGSIHDASNDRVADDDFSSVSTLFQLNRDDSSVMMERTSHELSFASSRIRTETYTSCHSISHGLLKFTEHRLVPCEYSAIINTVKPQ